MNLQRAVTRLLRLFSHDSSLKLSGVAGFETRSKLSSFSSSTSGLSKPTFSLESRLDGFTALFYDVEFSFPLSFSELNSSGMVVSK